MPRIDALTTLKHHAEDLGYFRPGDPVNFRTARACLDVLGSLNAESGGTIAQMTLPARVAVAAQFDPVPRLRIRSGQITPPLGEPEISIPLGPDRPDPGPKAAWAAPLVRLALATFAAGDDRVGGGSSALPGVSILIHSNIPQDAGQSSSTALLCAAALALAEPRQTPSPLVIAQRVAAAEAPPAATQLPTGTIINALTCLHASAPPPPGRPSVLRYSAQPHRYVGPVPLPENVRMLALDTGVRFSSDSGGWGASMDEFSLAAAMGMRLIETIYRDLGQPHIPLHGYLANTSPLLYRQYFRTLLPRRMRAGDFLRTYGPLPELTGDKDRLFRVRTVVDHLIAEHEHAEQFLQALEELAEGGPDLEESERQKILQRAGRLLLASHHSYRLRLELSCREADWLVDRLMEAGPDRGIYGARITGRGGGGTVAALLARTPQATDALLEVMNAYNHLTGITLGVTEG